MTYGKRNRSRAGLPAFTSWLDACKPVYIIIGFYAIAVIIRYAMACFTSNGPTIYIDEGLYINIARGLTGAGEVTYRGQPVSYVYLMYPLLLTPLFLLPSSVDLFRAVQLWNILIMTSAIVPGYLLARRMNLSRPTAYIVVLFLLVMPDMILSSVLISECLLYPLMMWLFYFAYRMSEGEKPVLTGCAVAVLTAALYFTKPGNVAFGIVFMLLTLLRRMKEKEWKKAGNVGLAMALTLGLVIGGYLLYGGLFDELSSPLSLYSRQVPSLSLESVFRAFLASGMHLIMFLISGVCIVVVLPILRRKNYSSSQRLMLDAVLIATVVSVVGTAAMVTLDEWNGEWAHLRVHLRYLMYYMPLFWMYLLKLPEDGALLSRKGAIACGLCLLLFIFPSAFAGVSVDSSFIDSMSLSVFYDAIIGKTPGIVWTMAALVFLVPFVWSLHKRGLTRKWRNAMVAAVLLLTLANNVAGYGIRVFKLEAEAVADANEIVRNADEEMLYLTTNIYMDRYDALVDARVRRPTQFVRIEDMLENAVKNQGAYNPFSPVVSEPNYASIRTPNVSLFAANVSVFSHLELSENAVFEMASNEVFSLIRIEKGKPWLKTAISNLAADALPTGNVGSLVVYDAALLQQGRVTLHINMCTFEESTSVHFTTAAGTQRIEVSPEPSWYTIELPVYTTGFNGITFTCDDNLTIIEHWTE